MKGLLSINTMNEKNYVAHEIELLMSNAKVSYLLMS